jgi:hypothetical protein
MQHAYSANSCRAEPSKSNLGSGFHAVLPAGELFSASVPKYFQCSDRGINSPANFNFPGSHVMATYECDFFCWPQCSSLNCADPPLGIFNVFQLAPARCRAS